MPAYSSTPVQRAEIAEYEAAINSFGSAVPPTQPEDPNSPATQLAAHLSRVQEMDRIARQAARERALRRASIRAMELLAMPEVSTSAGVGWATVQDEPSASFPIPEPNSTWGLGEASYERTVRTEGDATTVMYRRASTPMTSVPAPLSEFEPLTNVAQEEPRYRLFPSPEVPEISDEERRAFERWQRSIQDNATQWKIVDGKFTRVTGKRPSVCQLVEEQTLQDA